LAAKGRKLVPSRDGKNIVPSRDISFRKLAFSKRNENDAFSKRIRKKYETVRAFSLAAKSCRRNKASSRAL
jgi:hypothetical protein